MFQISFTATDGISCHGLLKAFGFAGLLFFPKHAPAVGSNRGLVETRYLYICTKLPGSFRD